MSRTPLLLLALLGPSLGGACLPSSGARVIKTDVTLVGRLDPRTPELEDTLWFVSEGRLVRCRGSGGPTCTRLMAVPEDVRAVVGYTATARDGKIHLVSGKYTDVVWLLVGGGRVHRCAVKPEGESACSLVHELGQEASALATFQHVSSEKRVDEAVWFMTEDQRVYRCATEAGEPTCELVPGS